jgi:hypothetical protein
MVNGEMVKVEHLYNAPLLLLGGVARSDGVVRITVTRISCLMQASRFELSRNGVSSYNSFDNI